MKKHAVRFLFSPKPLCALVAAMAISNASAQQSQVFGFESLDNWSSSAGARALSTEHSQGEHALAISGFSYSELVSSPLSTLTNVTDELALDIRLPAQINWGQAQIYVSSHTLGLHSYWVGEANIAGLSAGSFHTLTIPVAPSLQTTLQQTYSDLSLKVVLNMPYSAQAVLVDNLRFNGGDVEPDCAENSAFNVVVTVEGAFDDQILQDMVCTFHTIYPQLVARFNPNAPQTVFFKVADIKDIAGAAGNEMAFMRSYMLNNPNDTDVVIHEGMHLVQAYQGNTPGYLVEGIADYVRNSYGLRNSAQGWTLQNYRYGLHYVQGYGVVGAFLQWLEENYTVDGGNFVDALDQLLRSGNYSPNIWQQWTGDDLDHLWQMYSVEKGALFGEQPAPLPAQQGITIFGDADFQGDAVMLDVGDYGPADITAHASPTSWFDVNAQDAGISSVVVPAGYQVTFYSNSDFTGASSVYTADESFIGDLNDNVHSIRVELLP